MTPECTHSLCHLEALKEQLAFHYHRITQHVVSFADSRLRTLPIGGPPSHALCISTWAQCVGYELICELLDSLIKEVEQLRHDCIKEVALKAAKDFSEGASSHNASASAAASAAAAAAAASRPRITPASVTKAATSALPRLEPACDATSWRADSLPSCSCAAVSPRLRAKGVVLA
mmetsp:Transcript_4917/g.9368  ORF Transcript_4917/g.9368 Transcript_4917/m.9368 type:complete len:175 (-) Transcript_4917:419-943(-)